VGEIVIRKEVVEETQTITVPVRHEVVHIERHGVTDDEGMEAQAHPASDPPSDGPWEPTTARRDAPLQVWPETIRIPVVHEELRVERVARVVEEIVVVKEVVQEVVTRSEPVLVERVSLDEVRSGSAAETDSTATDR
jgi:stress response protein YsnF